MRLILVKTNYQTEIISQNDESIVVYKQLLVISSPIAVGNGAASAIVTAVATTAASSDPDPVIYCVTF